MSPPCGSQKLRGSTSRINLLAARMILHLVHLLVTKGGFSYDEILVIVLYSDQVTLLEALCADATNGIRVKTIDGSKGSEALVVIVDCMTLGAATEEGMGFLDEDQRRFNVAMSRAQVGRITVYHKGMIKMIKGKPMVSGAWNEFLEQANAANDILDSHYLNGKISFTTLEAPV